LRACLLARARPDFAVDATSGLLHDPAAATLLPLLDRQYGESLPGPIREEARRYRITLWRQARDHLDQAASIAHAFSSIGIEPVFLKGAALIAHYYPEPGLRGAGDVDLLVPRAQVSAAVGALLELGWSAEDGLSAAEIERLMRARHAWQFYKATDEGGDLMCDLHWHPVVRCYSPRVAEMFLEGSEPVAAGERHLRIPCATDLLFHILVHGLQWTWTSPIRWIPDAWFVIGSGAVDWPRLRRLAVEASMTFRVHRALDYLNTRFEAPVPAEALESLAKSPDWEAREQKLLEQTFPLGLVNAARWHGFNFRRLRRFDPAWRDLNPLSGFLSYLSVFLQTKRRRDVPGALWRRVRPKSAA